MNAAYEFSPVTKPRFNAVQLWIPGLATSLSRFFEALPRIARSNPLPNSLVRVEDAAFRLPDERWTEISAPIAGQCGLADTDPSRRFFGCHLCCDGTFRDRLSLLARGPVTSEQALSWR
jgi:hypothetical protein